MVVCLQTYNDLRKNVDGLEIKNSYLQNSTNDQDKSIAIINIWKRKAPKVCVWKKEKCIFTTDFSLNVFYCVQFLRAYFPY